MRAHTQTRSLIIGATLVLGTAAAAGAQGQQLFQWSGQVDQEIQLTMSGRNLTVAAIGPREPGQGRSNVRSSIPRQSGEVTVQLAAGRGSVDVIRQPTAQNGYTTVIRIRDPQGGAGDYRVNAFWQGSAAGEVAASYPNGNVNGNGNNRGRGYGRANRDNANNANNGVTNRVALQWSGDVDDNLIIRLAQGGVTYRTVSGKDPRGVQASFAGIPQGATQLTVNLTEGRGSVTVIQQPTAQNGYTASLRVLDPQGGYGHYAFTLNWR
jgi:hypothetical protein